MAASVKNTVRIKLAGQERMMRATFGAVQNIEQALRRPGEAARPWLSMVDIYSLGVSEIAVIVHEGLLANEDDRLNLQQVGEAIVDAGIGKESGILKAVTELIGMGFRGAGAVGKSEEPAKASQSS